MNGVQARTTDSFLLNYNADELRIASEFLSNWLPFLSRGLCPRCTQILSDRVRSLHPDNGAEPLKKEENLSVSTPSTLDLDGYIDGHDNDDTNSMGSWKDGVNDTADTNSLGSWKDGANGWTEPAVSSISDRIGMSAPVESPRVRMSWADMAQEDELEADEENELVSRLSYGNASSGEGTEAVKVSSKPTLSKEQREYIRFTMDFDGYIDGHDNDDTNSMGSWKDGVNDTADTNSLGSWKDGANGWTEPAVSSISDRIGMSAPVESPRVRMSWPDMAQEDELEADEENELVSRLSYGNASSGEGTEAVKVSSKPTLSKEQREYIRFTMDFDGYIDGHDNDDTNSMGSWKDGVNDTADTNSLGSWKDGANGWTEPAVSSISDRIGMSAPVESPRVRMSWPDMAQEDELEADEENELVSRLSYGNASSREGTEAVKVSSKPTLSREQRQYIRFTNVKRKKDYICFERIKGKLVNILDGLELHTGVFSAVEQKRIVDFVYELQEKGKNGKLKERTYTAPQKWMRGKGRVTIQFGCCYNYATDKNGNPPGILQNELVDTIPHLFKVIIRRLVRWHVIPPTCVPDSCIVNIYDEGDCIPPHIDNHDFLRPFCTVSFLSECNIVFGSNLRIVGAGEFDGPYPIALPVGSVLVFNGNGADVAKHCVPAVPTKRISITFRKMDESKWPIGFVPEPDLQGLKPLSYEDRSKHSNLKSNRPVNKQATRKEDNRDKVTEVELLGPGPRLFGQIREGPWSRRRVRLNLEN